MFTLQFTLCCHSNIGIFLLFSTGSVMQEEKKKVLYGCSEILATMV